MRFRRNHNEEKLFKRIGQLCLLLPILLGVFFFITRDADVLGLFLTCILLPPFFYFMGYSMSNNYIEFQHDKVVFINHIAPSVEINISEIELIMVPSPRALNRTTKENNIIFKRPATTNITSYTPEIEKYIIEHINVRIIYYDNYKNAINSAINNRI